MPSNNKTIIANHFFKRKQNDSINSANRNNGHNIKDWYDKGGRAKRATPFVVSASVVASVLSVPVLCEQEDQVVPAHQVDDIDEVHELNPVH